MPDISVIVPVRNEAGNIEPLVEEIARALQGRDFEIVYVDDGSTDSTAQELMQTMRARPFLRTLRHARSAGQSVAVAAGVAAARGRIIVTLDGDGQNDPSFIPALLSALETGRGIGLAAGQRTARKISGFKKFQSRVANGVRSAILSDGTRDTGCGLKAFRREDFLRLPHFNGMHRFLPALMRRDGHGIAYVEVLDRARRHGQSNYGLWNRLFIGILDMFGVWWLIRRRADRPGITEVKAP